MNRTEKNAKQTIFAPSLRKISGFSFLFLLLVAGFFIFPALSQAQITRVAKTVLESAGDFHVGPSIYLTKDPDKKLTPQSLVERHEHNLRGERQNTNIVNLGMMSDPVWLVFSVINNTKNENWVLDFGNVMNGRVTTVKDLAVYNYTAGITLIDTRASENTQELQGTAFALNIPRNQEVLFVVYVVPEGGIVNTISPRLVRQKDFLDNRFFLNTPLILATCFFILVMSFFATLSFFARTSEYLWFCLYYGLHFCLFAGLNSVFVAPFFFTGEAFKALFLLTQMVGLSQSKIFLNLRDEEYGENFTILVLNILIPLCFLLSLFMFQDGSAIHTALILVPPILVSMSMCILSFVQAQKGKYAGHFFAIGWAITTFGLLITTLTAAGLLQSTFPTVNAYWIFLVLQASMFALSCTKRAELVREEIKNEKARQNRAEQSLARLKQSKESADQARLLRVIERERELMADLREREMQRTEEMRIAKEIADEANRAKSAFLAVVSHEIRTPMTGIMGIVRLMADTKMSKEQNDYVLAIQKSGDTMMALLNDILDFEKIETGNMRLEEIDFDLPKLIQGVVMLMSGHAADKKISLKSDIAEDFPRFLIGDPTRLRQVLLNLINNAIKFTEQGSVVIRLRASLRDESPAKKIYDIYFAVEDTGVGISEEAQRNLFNPFEQADVSISRKYGGTGLGLAICQRLVEAMDSSIHISSQPGQGSTFYFTIAMAEGSAEKSAESDTLSFAAAAADAPVGLRILVIEDNEINRKVLQNFLEKDHHHVVVSESGEEAIEICSRENLDIIFTDINLAGMNGLETTRTIRTMPNKRIARIPVVAITGNVTDEDRKRCKEAGINDLLGKPIDYESLRKILANLADLQKQNENITVPPPASDTQKSAAAATSKPSGSSAVNPKVAIPMPPPAPPKTAPKAKDSTGRQGADSVYNEDSAVAPIHAYLKEMKKAQGITDDFEDDTFSQMMAGADAIEAAASNSSEICDLNVLQGLMDALGKHQVEELLKGYMDKADEIIKALDEQQTLQNVGTIRERAHELKGMAANFGITELSQIAGRAEKAAQNKDLQTALQEAQKLHVANQKANMSLKKWLESSAAKS